MTIAASPATTLRLGPLDSGRPMRLEDFVAADWTEGYLYELARGIVVVTEVPGINHGRIVGRLNEAIVIYDVANRGRIVYRAGGGECRLRLPGMQSDRHPDQAIYLTPPPCGKRIWYRWVPAIVVEIVSRRGENRDYVEKREEYLRCGVLEYWIFDPRQRTMLVLRRAGDIWEEQELGEAATHQTELLPGLVISVAEILGPAVAVEDQDEDIEPPTI